ncbi:MAG: phosphoribosylanthranilate isomerase [Sulfuricella sp.]|jgi:phosphoribosylanthranilate isomerase|nr:phosphoribosylanthranilate isomerase [Sulfuricella sp.]
MTRIKICGIIRSEDALVCAQAGVDAIGLVFYPPSSRHILAAQAAVIARALPPFVTTVGLFVNPAVEQVKAVLNEVHLDVLQFHGDEPPEFCASFGVPYLKAIRVKAGVDLVQCAIRYQEAQGLLLDAYVEGTPGGTGQPFDWELIPAGLPLPVILSGGLEPANVADAIRRVRPWAVDVSSGVEASKGIKDAAKIAAFIEGVRSADV